jgi:hypothetical protein
MWRKLIGPRASSFPDKEQAYSFPDKEYAARAARSHLVGELAYLLMGRRPCCEHRQDPGNPLDAAPPLAREPPDLSWGTETGRLATETSCAPERRSRGRPGSDCTGSKQAWPAGPISRGKPPRSDHHPGPDAGCQAKPQTGPREGARGSEPIQLLDDKVAVEP